MPEASPPVSMQPAALLRPATDIGAKIEAVLAEQSKLNAQIDGLNKKLVEATAQTTQDRDVLLAVDGYVTKLKAARKRVAALHDSLEGTKSRLLKVHAHLKQRAAAVEDSNSKLSALVEQTLAKEEEAAAA